MVTDKQLIMDIQRGDTVALETLMERHRGALHRYISGMARDPGAADDLSQEVFLRLWTRADQWDGRGSVRGWLFRIAGNLTLNHLRSRSRRREEPMEHPVGSIDDAIPCFVPVEASWKGPGAAAEASERWEILQRLTRELPDSKREVFLLVREQGLEINEVSDLLGIPEGTVKSRLHYATQRIRDEWKQLDLD